MSGRANDTGRFTENTQAGRRAQRRAREQAEPASQERHEPKAGPPGGSDCPLALADGPDDERAVLGALAAFERQPEALADLAVKDARGESAEREAAFLRHPLVARRWRRALVELNNDVEAQLGRRRRTMERLTEERGLRGVSEESYRRELADYNRWRDGTLKFKATLETAMAEAREHLKGLSSVGSGQARADALAEQSKQSQAYRALLAEVRDFLRAEAQLHPLASGRRDELLERIDLTLFPGARQPDSRKAHAGEAHAGEGADRKTDSGGAGSAGAM